MAPKQQHRENLVRTAMRLFRRQGYAATGLVQITQESGAPKGSLYHYFPGGKEDLGRAAVEMAGQLVAEMYQDALSRTQTVEAFLDAVTGTYADWMAESGFRSGCPIATALLECAPESGAITGAGQTAFDEWIRITAAAFTRSGLAPDDARFSAEVFVSAIEGALILARVRQDDRPLRAIARHFSQRIASRN